MRIWLKNQEEYDQKIKNQAGFLWFALPKTVFEPFELCSLVTVEHHIELPYFLERDWQFPIHHNIQLGMNFGFLQSKNSIITSKIFKSSDSI